MESVGIKYSSFFGAAWYVLDGMIFGNTATKSFDLGDSS